MLLMLMGSALVAQEDEPEPRYDRKAKVVYQDLKEVFRRRPIFHKKNLDALVVQGTCPTELLIYHDVETRAEVWRLTWHKGWNAIHSHINRSPWNADGSKIGLWSNRGMPGVWKRETTGLGDPHPYVMEPDGSTFTMFRQRVQGFTTLYAEWWSWDRTDPNVAYWPTHTALWRSEFTPEGPVVERVVDLPNPERRKNLFAPVGENGILMVRELNSRKYKAQIYIIDVNESKIIHTYPIAMNLDWPKHDKKMEFGFHDCTFRRNPENSYIINYGSQGAVGEFLFFEFPLDGDKRKIKIAYPNEANPNIPYYSHPAWAHGGRLISYFGLEEFGDHELNPGWHIRDHDANKPVVRLIGGWVGGHIAWDGYDPDWIAAAVSSRHVPEYRDTWIMHAYIPDGVAKMLTRPHTRKHKGRLGYGSHPRPAQSPDATKIMFHSTMLQRSGNFEVDLYVAVSHKPAPPTKLVAKKVQDHLTIEWTPPDIRREIKGYFVYRRLNDQGPWHQMNREPINANLYVCTPAAVRPKSEEYFVTAIEHSGLESDRTSPVLRMGGGEKPALTGWDKTPPKPPRNAASEPTAAGPKLSWTPPTEADLRYVNVYFCAGEKRTPRPIQQNRIASVIRATEYVDWSAPKGIDGCYCLTAVDRQGNESPAVVVRAE